MNWILENKNKNLPRRTILQKAKLWWGGISRGKKTKTLVVVLILVCVFFVTAPAAHAEGIWPLSWVSSAASSMFTKAISYILEQIQNLMNMLLGVVATLFAVVIAPENISGTNGMLNKQAVKDVWIMVRDTLNMFFILVLLFSAFCTIFQVEKWNLKKIWLNILINALLVNFSFPIARIIIDISNVAMYYFVNHLFTATGTVTGSSIMASFSSVTQLSAILNSQNYASNPITMQIAMIIFTFILAMTLLVVAILFLVRLIALTLLIMFSPIGFVGYIFPSTASYADDWWKKLFSYSFFAPIMIFGMAIALKMAEAMNSGNSNSFLANASVNTGAKDASWFASAAFFAVPIVVLWSTMGVAKSMGIAGADTVVGAVKKGGKALAMMGPGNWAKKNWEGYSKARKSRQEEIDKKRRGGKIGRGLNELTDKGIGLIPGKLGDNARNRNKDVVSKTLNEDVEKARDKHTTTPEDSLTGHLKSDAARDAAKQDRSKGVEFLAQHKEFMSDAGKRAEHDARIDQATRNDVAGINAVKNSASYTSARNDAERQAVIESHVKAQVAKSYSTMGSNAAAVRKAHTIK